MTDDQGLSLGLAESNASGGQLNPADIFLLNVSHGLLTQTSSFIGLSKVPSVMMFLPEDFNLTDHLPDDAMERINRTVPSPRLQSQLRVVRYTVIVLYLITFLFGLIGNSLTILVILKNNRMKTVASCFILNLAVADDLFMLSLPFFAHSTFTGTWVFGSVMCSLMTAFYGINLYASIFTMVLMSIDRYLAIVHPLRSIRYRTIRNAVIVCICIWSACIVIMTPYWLYARTSPQNGAFTCTVLWPVASKMTHFQFWDNFELIIGFVLPILIMVICYMELLRHIVKDDGPLQNQTRMPIKKVTAMVFMVTIVFIVCWTPYHILKYANLMRKVGNANIERPVRPPDDEIVKFVIYQAIAQALVFISSCCNPFIYGISSKNFRRMYISVVCKCCLPYDVATRRGQVLHPRASSYFRGRSTGERQTEMTVSCTDAPNGSVMALRRFEFTQNEATDDSTRPAHQSASYRRNNAIGRQAEKATKDLEVQQMLMEQSLL